MPVPVFLLELPDHLWPLLELGGGVGLPDPRWETSEGLGLEPGGTGTSVGFNATESSLQSIYFLHMNGFL